MRCCPALYGSRPSALAASREAIDLLVEGGTVVTMDSDRRVIDDGAVAIRSDAIVAVGTRAELGKRYTSARHINDKI